jgi:hypothetical protein
MNSFLLRLTCLFAVILPAAMANPASAQMTPNIKARCDQLIAYFDYYGASRSQNSDGLRNFTRIGAGIDCDRGRFEKGIKTMEPLLSGRSLLYLLPPQGLRDPAGGSHSRCKPSIPVFTAGPVLDWH